VLLTLAIREVLPATPRARLVRLDLDGTEFDYLAGQAVLVGAAGGQKRPYSICAPPDETRRTGFIELLVGVGETGAAGPHLPLEAGGMVEVEGPLGSFTFPSDPVDRRFVFVAGGTGIAPLRAMLRQALTLRGHRIGLFYSARTPDEFAYEAELRLLASTGRIELRQTITRTGHDAWDGARGRIGRDELGAVVHVPDATLAFVCGPAAFVAEMRSHLGELGVERARIRVEEWG
jgi:ferredoxin-NADP reductase